MSQEMITQTLDATTWTSGTNAQSYFSDAEYLILTRTLGDLIWKNSSIGSYKWRNEIFDCIESTQLIL